MSSLSMWLSRMALVVVLTGAARYAAAQDYPLLAGTVRAQAGTPVPMAEVVFGDGGPAAVTDEQGRFSLPIPAETAGRLAVRAVGFTPAELPVAPLPAGARREVAVTLAPLF
ncbi:MAG: carboxypeptidase regulatory-like domain-containing protein, partial [Gemmatimonadales bacterium]|nr:carboxypeptidase regulatory-like domain-containing protein [Gemmatimonadales bacterium]